MLQRHEILAAGAATIAFPRWSVETSQDGKGARGPLVPTVHFESSNAPSFLATGAFFKVTYLGIPFS